MLTRSCHELVDDSPSALVSDAQAVGALSLYGQLLAGQVEADSKVDGTATRCVHHSSVAQCGNLVEFRFNV